MCWWLMQVTPITAPPCDSSELGLEGGRYICRVQQVSVAGYHMMHSHVMFDMVSICAEWEGRGCHWLKVQILLGAFFLFLFSLVQFIGAFSPFYVCACVSVYQGILAYSLLD